MNAIMLGEEAIQVVRWVWSNSTGGPSLTGIKWLYSPEGALAFLIFLRRMETLPDYLRGIIQEIFWLQVEIAARKAGWCPELEPQPGHAECT